MWKWKNIFQILATLTRLSGSPSNCLQKFWYQYFQVWIGKIFLTPVACVNIGGFVRRMNHWPGHTWQRNNFLKTRFVIQQLLTSARQSVSKFCYIVRRWINNLASSPVDESDVANAICGGKEQDLQKVLSVGKPLEKGSRFNRNNFYKVSKGNTLLLLITPKNIAIRQKWQPDSAGLQFSISLARSGSLNGLFQIEIG